VLLGREWYQHPNGQLPAYEWAFGDVNPPVQAWAAWRVYKIEQKRRGSGDRAFLERVFQKHSLPQGKLVVAGERVRPEAIKDTALFTIEGELDDISGAGQTQAAHELCSGIPAAMQEDYVVPQAGHYGIFSGRRWRELVCPKITSFIRQHG